MATFSIPPLPRLNNRSLTSVKPEIRAAVAHRDAPFAVLDLDAALANAADMVRRAAGTPIRVATKSLRIRQLISKISQQPGFQGLLAYCLPEAIWLVEEGTSEDIVVAYPSAHREALRQLLTQERLRRSITIMVDSVEHLDAIDSIVAPNDRSPVRVCVDIDASLELATLHIGALRSPLRTAQQVTDFVRLLINRPGFQLVGLMAYEGQIAGTTDTSPAIALMKTVSSRELAARRADIVHAVAEQLSATGHPPLEFVNGGGTGSIETTAAEDVITEIGAGSGIIGSGLFDHYKHFHPQPAQWFVLPVVRRPADDIVTVAGGGRVASGPVGKDRLPVVDWPQGLKTSSLEGFGEVQTPLKGEAARTLRLGDHVWMRPAKAGEQTEYINTLYVVSHGQVTTEWPTYRGEGRSFV